MTLYKKDYWLGKETLNYQGSEMKIVEYNGSKDIYVEFSKPRKCRVHGRVSRFKTGHIQNPYLPSVIDVGIVGQKYPVAFSDGSMTKEYQLWTNMLKRCFDPKVKEKQPRYQNVTCCEEWKTYENVYEWIHLQDNFYILKELNDYAIDKDILLKGNKIYEPDKCSLVPQRVNNLLLKSDVTRGACVIGVFYHEQRGKYVAQCNDKEKGHTYLGSYGTELEAFNAYKKRKEEIIKRVANEEFQKGTITKQCYDALLNYEIEITD